MSNKSHDLGAKIIGIALAGFLLFWLATALPGSWKRSQELNRELAVLNTQINNLEQRNKELAKEAQNYKTPEFLEQQARLRFNYQKKGEQAVFFVERASTGSVSATSSPKSIFEKVADWAKKIMR